MHATPTHVKPVRRGFTLIELLVVISIVSILISILLPALRGARTAASMSQSLSNLRQLQVSLHAYANDFDGYLTPSRDPYWAGTLHEGQYLTEARILWSPGRDTSMLDFGTLTNANYAHSFWFYTGYGVNGHGAMPSTSMQQDEGYRLINLSHGSTPPLSRFIAMVEVFSPAPLANKTGDGYYSARPRRTSQGMNPNPFSVFTYNGGVARAYLDGHARGSDSNEIGWSALDQRNGSWTYSAASAYTNREPWYHQSP